MDSWHKRRIGSFARNSAGICFGEIRYRRTLLSGLTIEKAKYYH